MWIDLRQTKTKMITGLFYAHRLIHFVSGNASFFGWGVTNKLNNAGSPHLAAVPVAVHLLVNYYITVCMRVFHAELVTERK